MKSVRTVAAASVTLLAAVACDRPMEPTVRFKAIAPSFATALAEGEQMRRVDLVQDTDGKYMLEDVCDVFIGDPIPEAGAAAPQRYTHQTVAVVPAGATVKLVGTAAMRETGETLYTCDARDPDDPTQPVIDPITLHGAKGDAPQINTNGVTLDLNGYSLTVSPAFGEDPAFENIGVVLAGDDVTLTNSAVAREDGSGVSRIFGFGHNVDVEAVRPKVLGKRFNVDGSENVNGPLFNLETRGGMGIRLSVGPMVFDQVKSVNLDPAEGQGFEARRLTSGILTVTNSWFEGGAEGVFIREAQGVTLQNNYVSGRSGPGISTRQATSTTARPIKFIGNTVDNSAQGIVWGRDSRNNNGSLVISGNSITRYRTCGIARSNRNTTIAPLTLASIAAANSFDRTTQQTCTIAD